MCDMVPGVARCQAPSDRTSVLHRVPAVDTIARCRALVLPSTTSNARAISTARSVIRRISGSRTTTPPPWAELTKPLSQCRVGLIGSGGIYQAGQVAFHYKDDISFRIIDTREPTSTLRATHFAYDLTDARSDPNVVFPIDTLNELAREGFIGCVGGTRVRVHGRHLFVAPRARTAGAGTRQPGRSRRSRRRPAGARLTRLPSVRWTDRAGNRSGGAFRRCR